MDSACWLWKKGSRLSKLSAGGNFSLFPTWRTRSTTGCGARSTSLWVHRNLFWQLSGDRNLHGLGMSHAMTASPKPSFKASRRVGDAVVSKGNAGWTTSKSRNICLCQNCLQGPPTEKTGMWSLLNHPSCPPYDPISQGTELNWIKPLSIRLQIKTTECRAEQSNNRRRITIGDTGHSSCQICSYSNSGGTCTAEAQAAFWQACRYHL